MATDLNQLSSDLANQFTACNNAYAAWQASPTSQPLAIALRQAIADIRSKMNTVVDAIGEYV